MIAVTVVGRKNLIAEFALSALGEKKACSFSSPTAGKPLRFCIVRD